MDYLINTPLLSYLVSYSNNKNKFRESKVLTINKSAAKAILKYQKKEKVDFFIKKIKSKKFDLKKLIVLGSLRKLWPLHLQIELTDNCNLYCDYCYRNAKNNIKKANYISFYKIKKSLDNLKSKNLLEIGITGGEPTLHPDFKDIMHYVLKNFELVELVTNAKNKEVLIDMLKTLSSKMESRLNLSISFNKWLRDLPKFKSKKHYLFKTLKEITKIHSVRVICTDYFYNNFKSKEIVKLLKNVGVKSIDFSFVLPIGRGKNKINELEYLKRYPFRKKKSFTPTGYNCGLILKHTAVDPSGNLRPCALFPLSFVIGSLYSNLFKKDFRKLYTLQAPNKEICGDCKNYLYCVGCIYKGLYNANKNCEYKKYIKGEYSLLLEALKK